MEPHDHLPLLLGFAVLLPLFSFFVILIAGPKMGKAGQSAGYFATACIGGAAVLSFIALFALWLPNHYPVASHHGGHGEGEHHDAAADESAEHGEGGEHGAEESPAAPEGDHAAMVNSSTFVMLQDEASGHADEEHAGDSGAHSVGHGDGPPHYTGDFNVPLLGSPWVLGQFGDLRLSISYYIDALTISMFCMVTFIATLIHIYAMGYMHEELHDVTDHEVTISDGSHLHRPGRYHRFFQYLSLFCFSMLGLVLAGNIAMVFVFWELVGVCSYFLIGFYVERKSASNAANKAFIVNRVGDFGMILGLMALWAGLGTFSFGEYAYTDAEGHNKTQEGIFNLVRATDDHQLETPAGMVKLSARPEVVRELGSGATAESVEAALTADLPAWRDGTMNGRRMGYGLMILAGVGIFAGCVGKSAQFPLHTWLPDAMEGPTPVSALVHSATMVAAGVYLVARFFPVFVPEVLLVIAVIGCITLFMAATIAITATDIKRVLAYSTISQLGYMMMALGVGAWVAGVMHLITHAFFKSLLFMCSGSVIHAVHSNEMTDMGGLRKKMPITAYTMLVGCLAIAGAGIPFIMGFFGMPLAGLGLSGFYSKDKILEQAFSFMGGNGSAWAGVFFVFAAGGAAITAFYMFRMWYMTFAGKPRDPERYAHAHESPPAMYVPLVVLSVMAVAVAWSPIQGILGGLIATVALFLASRRFAGEPEACETAGAGGEHARGEQGEQGHDEQGHDEHATLPASLPNLPWKISLGVLILSIVWFSFSNDVVLENLLEQARPLGTLAGAEGVLLEGWSWPSEHDAHAASIVVPVSIMAIGTAFSGFLLATVMYGMGYLDPADVRRQFEPIYRFLVNKWWFDELYDWLFVRPSHLVAGVISAFDRRWIDWFIDSLAGCTAAFSRIWDRIADQTIVDGFVNTLARWTYSTGLSLRTVQTGSLRQYIVFVVVGVVAIFILISFFWNPTLAG